MKAMVKGMLIAFWRNNNGIKPEHILFYRDGVSDGQFQDVSLSPMTLTTLSHQ